MGANRVIGRRGHTTIRDMVGDVSKGLKSTGQRRRQLGVDEEAHLRAPQDGVIVLAGRELEHGRNVLRLEVRIVC